VLFLRNGFHGFAYEEVVVLFGLVRPSLIRWMPGDAILVDPSTVGWMPFEPPNRLLGSRPNPAAGVGSISADPVIRRRDLL